MVPICVGMRVRCMLALLERAVLRGVCVQAMACECCGVRNDVHLAGCVLMCVSLRCAGMLARDVGFTRCLGVRPLGWGLVQWMGWLLRRLC